ncbi:uncharacterized protein [Amphiura filiformis]|uniref:uncharacterized protein n=1 Tax=Amphiura filiformis TaxID=82378 RepID=UPI003B22275E
MTQCCLTVSPVDVMSVYCYTTYKMEVTCHMLRKWLHLSIILVGFTWSWKGKTTTAFLVDSEIGNHTVYVGQNVTLTCDLNSIGGNTIFWYHIERLLYLSYQETLHDSVPLDVRNRMSIVCSLPEESCALTITNVTFDDGGTYQCGHEHAEGVLLLTDGYLNVIPIPLPPSKNSPLCTWQTPGGMRNVSGPLIIGETIALVCSVFGTITEPSLVWQRDKINITDVKTTLLLYPNIMLSKADVGVEFTCIMNHPALDQSRTCSVVPLPLPPTLPNEATTDYAINTRPPTNTESISTRPLAQSNTIPIIISAVAVLTLVILSIVILLIFCKRRNNKTKNTSTNQDVDQKQNNGSPDTEMTAEMNSPEQPHDQNQLSTQRDSSPKGIEGNEDSCTTDDQTKDCPVYKKKKKDKQVVASHSTEDQYINLPHLSSDVVTGKQCL